MQSDLEAKLLSWIGEELLGTIVPHERAAPVAIKFLMVRLALSNRDKNENLSQSLEISLNAFDRATLYRVLRQLHKRKYIELVDSKGKPLGEAERQAFYTSDKVLGYVCLTEAGAMELRRLKLCEQAPSA